MKMQRPVTGRADADAIGVEGQVGPSKIHDAIDDTGQGCMRHTSNILDALRAELNQIAALIGAVRNENVRQHECLVSHINSIMQLQSNAFDHHVHGLANSIREQHQALASSLEAKIDKIQARTPTNVQFSDSSGNLVADSYFLDGHLAIESDSSLVECPQTVASTTELDRTQERLEKIRSRNMRLHHSWIVEDATKNLPMKNPSSRLVQFVESDVFAALVSIAIVANTISIGIQADISIKNVLANSKRDDPSWMRYTNLMFTILFSVELAIRLIALRCSYFMEIGWRWNMFDTVLVVSAIVDELVQDLGNATFLRALRIVKATRAVRILRVFRFFQELRLMVISVIASLAALSWAFLLLLILLYWFAIVFTQGMAVFLKDNTMDHQTMLEVEEWYPSVPQAMLTLLLAISGGYDWHQLAKPLLGASLAYFMLFVVYIFFVVFGLLNVLTAIFCERAQNISYLDKDLVVLSETEKTDAFYIDMTRIFKEAKRDKNDTITWNEFKQYLTRDDVQAYFATLELRNTDARELFKLLDRQHLGCVSVEEFIFGCMRVAGSARSFDLLRLENNIKSVDMKVLEICRQLHRGQHLLRQISPDSSSLDCTTV